MLKWFRKRWQAITEVFEFDFWEWLFLTRTGRTTAMGVITLLGSLATHALGIDPRWQYAAIGGFVTSLIIFVPSLFGRKAEPDQYLPTFFRPPRAESMSPDWAKVVEVTSDIQRDMTEVLIAYREVAAVWNRYWRDLRNAKRRHRSSDEWQAMHRFISDRDSQAIGSAMEALDRRLDVALAGLHSTHPT